jgi:hypothetical protein
MRMHSLVAQHDLQRVQLCCCTCCGCCSCYTGETEPSLQYPCSYCQQGTLTVGLTALVAWQCNYTGTDPLIMLVLLHATLTGAGGTAGR